MTHDGTSPLDDALRVRQLEEARWQAILDTARDGIVSIDQHGRITLFNRAAEAIFGYAAAEVIGRNVSVLMPSPYREEHDAYIDTYRRTGVARAIGRIRDVQGRHKDGRIFPLELSVSAARVGDEVLYSAIARDVTERHAMLAGLEKYGREQAAVADFGLRALELDVPRLLQHAVETVARTLSVDRCRILEILPGADVALVRAGVGWRDGVVGVATVPLGPQASEAGYAVHTGQPVLCEGAAETRFAPDALVRAHDAVASASVPIHGSSGVFGVLNTHATRPRRFTTDDVRFLQAIAALVAEAVERARAEMRLTTQHAVTRALAHASSLHDAMPQLSEAVCHGLRFRLAELWRVDQSTQRLRREATWHHPDIDGTPLEAAPAITFAPDEGLPGRTWSARRVQWAIDVSADATFMRPWLARERGLRSAVTVPVVVGEQVDAVLALFGLSIDPPDERLLDVLQSIGMQIGDFIARKRAEEAGERRARLVEIGTLTAKIVHDIGNPLAGLSMLASRISRRLTRNPQEPIAALRDPIDRLLETTKRLDGLIQEFKSFAREQHLDLEELRLDRFLEDVVRAWQPEASERGIVLLLEPEAVPRIQADPAKLRRVFDNLVKNALEAIDRGPGWIRISTSIPTNEKVRITVEDDGPGIPDELRLFELFATTKHHGTGLGLAISKQILLAHGGGIQFASREGHGAMFHVDLPQRKPIL